GALFSQCRGFADQSTFEMKLSGTLDRVIRQATDGRHDYSSEIKPWFGGQVALDLPKNPVDTTTFRMSGAGYLTITDAAKAKAYLDGLIGSSPTLEARDGVPVYLFDKGAYAIDGTVLVLGDVGACILRGDGSPRKLQIVLPSTAFASLPTLPTSRLAAHLPASTIAEYGLHDVGKTLQTVIDNCRKDPEIAKVLQQVDQAVSSL